MTKKKQKPISEMTQEEEALKAIVDIGQHIESLKKVEAKAEPLHAIIVLDRSGSMISMWEEACSSINTYLSKLAEGQMEGDVYSVVLFDSTSPYLVIADKVELKGFKHVDFMGYTPNGMTPLYDAVGKTLTDSAKSDFKRTVVVVMTDGGENGSREYRLLDVTHLIKKAELKGTEVVFLGANFDASVHVQAFGMNSSKFANTSSANLGLRMAQTASKTRSYAATGMSMDYTQADKDEIS